MDEKCGDRKTISLNKIHAFGFEKVKYEDIREQVEMVSDEDCFANLMSLNEAKEAYAKGIAIE